MTDESEEFMNYLIELGVITPINDEITGGETMYRLSEDAEFFLPGIMEEHRKMVNSSIFDLWTLDMISIEFDENGDPMVALNDNSLDIEKVEGIEDIELRQAMYTILVAFAEKYI